MTVGHGTHVERALRKTAQLRNLTLSLRRASEAAARERLLSEFDSFVQRNATSPPGVRPVPLPSAEALLAGIRACWARGDYATIRRIAGLLPETLLDQNMLLRAYVTVASGAADRHDSRQPLHTGPDQKS